MSVQRKALPSREPLRMLTFPQLDGGLDLSRLDYRVDSHRSPEMKNLWWQDGILQCRDGQRLVWQPPQAQQGFAAWDRPYGGKLIYHAGTCLYAAEPDAWQMTPVLLMESVPENPGTFFRCGRYLYYKNRGGFYRIDEELRTKKVEALAYVPTVLRNADPSAPKAGELFESVNRLTPLRRVLYNAVKDVTCYRLPQPAERLEKVTVDGVELADTAYSLLGDCVEFAAAPAVGNTVEIVFAAANDRAFREMMEASCAAVFGGGQELRILLGGSASCPNAVFWNGGTADGMDDAYWPMEHALTVGDEAEAVTGFGRQYGDLLVLKEGSLWRLEAGSADTFKVVPVSSLVGCDLPGTAVLVRNNLVFGSREKGVFQVRSLSAAYETNVRCLSSRVQSGLLRDLRQARCVLGFDDGSRYWLCVDDRSYLWDYSVSSFDDPSWFYLEGVAPVAFFRDGEGRLFHLDREGRLTLLCRSFSDYGAAIEKVYRFPTLDFGTYDRRKHVESVLLSLRADTATDVTLEYEAEGIKRTDSALVRCRAWRLVPRDLRYRSLNLSPFAYIFRRRPCLRRVRHFSMTLRNAAAGSDLAIVSAQVFFRLAERER